MSRSPSTVPKDLCINIELKQRKTNNDWNKKDVVSTLPYTAFRRLPTYYYYYYNYLPLVSTGRQILFCSVLCCGSVVLWVHLWVCPSHKMALSMDQMFYNSPLIALLHFWPWKVRGQGQRCKNRENAEIVLLAVTLPQMVRFTSGKDQNVPVQFQGRWDVYACCASHCRFSCYCSCHRHDSGHCHCRLVVLFRTYRTSYRMNGQILSSFDHFLQKFINVQNKT